MAQSSTVKVHIALVVCQLINGVGSVIGKLGTHEANPIAFALMREVSAAAVILLTARKLEGFYVLGDHMSTIARTGASLFFNQIFYIVGVKVSNPVVGSAWQPAQPLFSLVLGAVLGFESLTLAKLGGLLFALAGAGFLVLAEGEAHSGNGVLGSVCFFCNCLGNALYIVSAKPLLQHVPPMHVTGASYLFASGMMLLCQLAIASSPWLFVSACPDCSLDWKGVWLLPSVESYAALFYFVMVQSLVGYGLLMWANKFAQPSAVLGYTALQPVASIFLTLLLVALGYNRRCVSFPLRSGRADTSPTNLLYQFSSLSILRRRRVHAGIHGHRSGYASQVGACSGALVSLQACGSSLGLRQPRHPVSSRLRSRLSTQLWSATRTTL